MKLYRVSINTTDTDDALAEKKTVWVSSETKAKAFAKSQKAAASVVESVDFPSGKKAIIDWLNENCNG